VQTNHTIFAPSFAASNDPDGQQPHYTLLLSSGNGSARIASYVPASPALTVLHTLHSHTSSCTTLALSPNGRYLATGGSDALISLFDTTEWVCARTLDRMAGGVKNISFSWDGGYVVGGSDEGTGLEIAYAETGEYVATVQTQTPAQAVAWHPSRYWLAYGQENGQLKIVGAGGGQL
jgi:THO complex subunit 3